MAKVIKSYSGNDLVWIVALSDTEMENLSIYTEKLKVPSIQSIRNQYRKIRDGRTS